MVVKLDVKSWQLKIPNQWPQFLTFEPLQRGPRTRFRMNIRDVFAVFVELFALAVRAVSIAL
jgi:hypothetical protein